MDALCPLNRLTISPGLRLTFCISLPLIFKLGLTILTPSLVGCLLVWLEQFRVSISGLQKMNAFFMLKMSQIKNGTALQTYNFLFLGTRKKMLLYALKQFNFLELYALCRNDWIT